MVSCFSILLLRLHRFCALILIHRLADCIRTWKHVSEDTFILARSDHNNTQENEKDATEVPSENESESESADEDEDDEDDEAVLASLLSMDAQRSPTTALATPATMKDITGEQSEDESSDDA